MTFHIVTLFPQAFSYLEHSIVGRAQEKGIIKVKYYNPREFSETPFRHIDDKPYGGGPGMVIEAVPIIRAIESALKNSKKKKTRIIWLSPSGKMFDQKKAIIYSKKFTDIIIICGRYEGIDERVKKIFKAESISIGSYILTGGELGAMAIIDAVSRQIKGVLGNFSSREESRIASDEVYTRPEILKHKGKSYRVPKVLLSGNHQKIEAWKKGKK